MHERTPIAARLAKVLTLLIAIVWLAAGGTKLLALPTFQDVLSNHGVLSDRLIRLAWVLPALEVLLGLIVLACGTRKLAGRPALRRTVAAASAGLLLLLSGYILMVPEEVFRTVGCGCQVAGLDILESPSRAVSVAINMGLIAAHWGQFYGFWR
jgi:hypothetical protein